MQDLETEMLNGQDPANFNITFYSTQNEAINEVNPLPNLYYNNTPFNEEIFARVEDVFNPDCLSISSFKIIISLLTKV